MAKTIWTCFKEALWLGYNTKEFKRYLGGVIIDSKSQLSYQIIVYAKVFWGLWTRNKNIR
jgi:hypothetical protein